MNPFLDFLTDVRVATAGILALVSSCLAVPAAQADFVDRDDSTYQSVGRFTVGLNNSLGSETEYVSLAMPDLVFPDAQDTAWQVTLYFDVEPSPPANETPFLEGTGGWWYYWSNGAQYPDPWYGGATFLPSGPNVEPSDGYLFPNAYPWMARWEGWHPDMGALRFHVGFAVLPGQTVTASFLLESQETHAPEPASLGLMILGALVGFRRLV